MALRGSARLRIAVARRHSSPAFRTGQPARHIQHAAFVHLRCENRPALHAAASSRAGPGAHLHLQQPALRGGGARVRLRLLARLSEHALPLGSAVRRFREWRANDHRSIHHLLRIEMATAQRHRDAAAARLRRAGAGAFQRATRAFSSSVRGGQHPGLQRHDVRAVFSRPAPPDETRFRQAAHHHDAQKSVAFRAGVIADGRFHQRRVLGNSRIA